MKAFEVICYIDGSKCFVSAENRNDAKLKYFYHLREWGKSIRYLDFHARRKPELDGVAKEYGFIEQTTVDRLLQEVGIVMEREVSESRS